MLDSGIFRQLQTRFDTESVNHPGILCWAAFGNEADWRRLPRPRTESNATLITLTEFGIPWHRRYEFWGSPMVSDLNTGWDVFNAMGCQAGDRLLQVPESIFEPIMVDVSAVRDPMDRWLNCVFALGWSTHFLELSIAKTRPLDNSLLSDPTSFSSEINDVFIASSLICGWLQERVPGWDDASSEAKRIDRLSVAIPITVSTNDSSVRHEYPKAVYQLLAMLRDTRDSILIRSLPRPLQKAVEVADYADLVDGSFIPEDAPNYSEEAAGRRVSISEKGLATLATHELRIGEQCSSVEATHAANPPIPKVGHDLLVFLSEQPGNRCAIADLPKRFLNANMLTVMDADRLIEFGGRNHCSAGGNLVVEDGWDFVSITGPNKKPMSEFIKESLDFGGDGRIREHVQLTAPGRVEASRLALGEQPRIIEPKSGGINKDTFRCAFPTSCAEDAKRRGKGRKTWKVAKERGEDYIRNHPFPGLNELARRSGCSPHTMKKAIGESKDLTRAQATHELSMAPPAQKRGREDDPAWQAQVDEALHLLIESAPKAKRAELNSPDMRTQLERMESGDLAKLVEDAQEQAKEHQKAAQRARARTDST